MSIPWKVKEELQNMQGEMVMMMFKDEQVIHELKWREEFDMSMDMKEFSTISKMCKDTFMNMPRNILLLDNEVYNWHCAEGTWLKEKV